ncbi:MAG: hypothetical protein M3033_06140 [Acidobacteriota bacterium]|nr:hypothetical protein [Acidobacteriota bacterium]
MQNPKKQLSEFQEKLSARIWELGQKLQVLEFFEECRVEKKGSLKLKVFNEFRYLFSSIWSSLRSDILINLNSLFDESKEAKRSLVYFIKKVKTHIKVLRKDLPVKEIKILEAEIDNQLTIIASKKAILDSIKTSRDRFYAHHDSKYVDNPKQLLSDAPLAFNDVVELLEFCRNVLNWHQNNTILCATDLWSEDRGKIELENLFCFVNRYFKMCEYIQKREGAKVLNELLVS